MNNSFGKLLRQTRVNNNVTLREFARLTSYDASNISKIERDLIPPPVTMVLRGWMPHLGMEEGSDNYIEFLDAAALARNSLPEDSPEGFRNKLLPAMLRTARSKNLTEDDFERLIKLLNK